MKLRALLFVFAWATLLAPQFAYAQLPKPTCTITASSGSVTVGQTTNLSWSSQNATAANITSLGSVSLSGTQGVIPTPPKTTYVATFTGPGGSAVCSIVITVNSGNGSGGYQDSATPTTGTNPIVGAGSNSAPQSIVPCNGIDCQACNVAQLVQRVINWLIGFSIPLAAAMFAWAGAELVFSGMNGNEGKRKFALGIFRNVGIGFVIVLCAWLAVQTVLKTILKPQYYKSWNTIQCIQANNNTAGGRQLNKSINDLLNSLPIINSNALPISVAPGGTFTGVGGEFKSSGSLGSCPPGYSYLPDADACSNADGTNFVDPSYKNTGAKGICSPGYSYLPDADMCSNEDGSSVVDPTPFPTKGTAGALCANDNPACSTAALQEYGLTQAQANAMSCIAITESGGNPSTPNSNTGACGTFQITNQTSRSNWQNPIYHGDGCSAATSCNNAGCNLQTAVLMFNQNGYQPWTGVCNSPGGCGGTPYGQAWNPSARSCVQRYDPGNL